jgi:hypothetical protein
MTKKGIEIKLDGSKALEKEFEELEKRLDIKQARSVVRKASTRAMVKPLRANITVGTRTGNFKRSFGNITGKSRKVAVIFVGARMGGKHKGYLANIIENNKFQKRYPGVNTITTQRRVGNTVLVNERTNVKKRPKIPGYGVRMHSGIFRKGKPFIKRTFMKQTKPYFDELATQVTQVLKRA